MIFFDVTKTGGAGHRSGLTRVSQRLRDALGSQAREVKWHKTRRTFDADGAGPAASDWLLTTELFSEEERPGLTRFLESRSCRTAAVFHDAIPLKHPHITWPQSVARQSGYMKLLSRFDRVWAVSQASRDELLAFWRWQDVEQPPPVDVLPLGADFDGRGRVTSRTMTRPPRLLTVGILEPRKNQSFLLATCSELWSEHLAFELHIVGRVNPHFGPPIVAQIKALRKKFPSYVHFHEAASDATVARISALARAMLFPTIAEGCGLPLLEALWMGIPCVCSDLPVLRENADAGGCLPVAVNDRTAWKSALTRIVTDHALHEKLSTEAMTRPLPTWAAAGEMLATALM